MGRVVPGPKEMQAAKAIFHFSGSVARAGSAAVAHSGGCHSVHLLRIRADGSHHAVATSCDASFNRTGERSLTPFGVPYATRQRARHAALHGYFGGLAAN